MQFCWTEVAIRKLVWATLDGEDAATIAGHLGCKKRTVQSMQIALKLRPVPKRRLWTDQEKALVRRDYAETETVKLAEELKRPVGQIHQAAAKLGIKKSHDYLSLWAKKNVPEAFLANSHVRGQVPWNKGLRHPKGWAPGRMAETQFKKGERRGKAAENWCPVGTIRADGEGYRRIKVREPQQGEPYGFGNIKAWPLLHHWVWEQAHGPVPPGYKIAFKDTNRGNCGLENLERISEAEMMRRNSVHNLPKELADVIQLAGALKRKLREAHEKGFGYAL